EKTQGENGVFRLQSGGWLHPLAVAAVLKRARDLYLNEHVLEAQLLLSLYADALEHVNNDVPMFASLLNQQRLEIAVLLQRISANLDYFGNPPGWVPSLSLEVGISAFRNDIKTAIPILYTRYWIAKHTKTTEDLITGMNETLSNLKKVVRENRS